MKASSNQSACIEGFEDLYTLKRFPGDICTNGEIICMNVYLFDRALKKKSAVSPCMAPPGLHLGRQIKICAVAKCQNVVACFRTALNKRLRGL